MHMKFLMAILLFTLIGCRAEEDHRSRFSDDSLQNTDDASDTATAMDTNSATATGTGDEDEPEPILPDCSGCPAIGADLNSLRCAIELCDDAVFTDQAYVSPVIIPKRLDQTRVAVAHFGHPSNDLAPLMNESYALMATGPALGTSHGVTLSYDRTVDEFAKDGNTQVYDVVEWSIELKAPPTAKAFQVHYIFFSEEYDDFVGTNYNDRFYMFLEAPSTNGGEKTIINFTQCRDGSYSGDFVCEPEMAQVCTPGTSYCYLAVNTALSECCWYEGCPNGPASTDISGTGYSCAGSSSGNDGPTKGSSTGWLVTSWPIEPGEEFKLTFHLHDTSDGNYDSEVILDKFLFLTGAAQGTKPI